MSSTRPLAIGLLYETSFPTPVERRQKVVELTLHAHREGFALLEAFEFSGQSVHDEAVRGAVLDLVSRADVAALVVAGRPGWATLRTIVEPTELPLHFLAEATAVREIKDRHGWVRLAPLPPQE